MTSSMQTHANGLTMAGSTTCTPALLANQPHEPELSGFAGMVGFGKQSTGISGPGLVLAGIPARKM